ncbi:MAG: S-adenosylmethionine tRNA ribosyltransferase [Myxococcaceae bacterium]|nr:MAG: S-adenosylmethionine tRNA ribosyltransferase [Myxococcaceae bacterium]
MKHALQDAPATVSKQAGRLLHVDLRRGTLVDTRIDSLPELLRPGDLLVVNDAATLPASLPGTARGEPIEVRLAGEEPDGTWRAVVFGAGDWRTPTESRPPPPALAPGDSLRLGPGLQARVTARSDVSTRLLWIRFAASAERFWSALYLHGRPVQYAYEPSPLSLDRVQTPYAARPWASEMPSAGRPLTLELLGRLRSRGVALARLTHAAGLSSTGDAVLDGALPLPERYELPAATVRAVAETRRQRGRVVAVGTTVVRALEGAALSAGGELRPGPGLTDLRIGRGFEPRLVSGLLSGIHARDSSHFELLSAFLPGALELLYTLHAAAGGYRGHEFGDSTLVLG